MRRIVVVMAAAGVFLGCVATPVGAQAPSPSASTASGTGETVCTINDRILGEASGLVALDDGYAVINDSNGVASNKRLFRLNAQCKVVSSVGYQTEARDPEDLAMTSDGTTWIADTGDNGAERTTVAFWKLEKNSDNPVIHRVTYPDGPRDAEAILMGSDGLPIIVTKESPAGVYVPTKALEPRTTAGVPLKRVGEIKIPASTTPTSLGAPGRLVITGGANSPNGKKVVLRTYADAFEWDVTDGDVVKAITTGTPRATPLPNEVQGESITYSRDGKTFITVSDVPAGTAAPLSRYTPTAPAPTTGKSATAKDKESSGSMLADLTLDQVTYFVVGVGAVGLVFVVVGIIGIRRSRVARRARAHAMSGRASVSGALPGEAGPGGPGGPGGRARSAPAGVYGTGVAVSGGDDLYGGRDPYGDDGMPGQTPTGRRVGGGEPSTTGNVYGAAGGRAGAVYGGRQDPSADRGWDEEQGHDPRGQDPRWTGQR